MNGPITLPNVDVEIINITNNSKGYKFHFKPIENLEDIDSYRIYLTSNVYTTIPNANNTSYLINEIPYSETDKYFFYIPNFTGLQYLTIFSKNKLGIESTGTLFSGTIPYQLPIKEISLKNINYYTDVVQLSNGIFSGGMVNASGSQEITVTTDYCYLGWQLSYISSTTKEVQAYDPTLKEYNFNSFFRDKSINIYNRVISAFETGNFSGILQDNTLLKSTNNDIFTLESLGMAPEKSDAAIDISITRTELVPDIIISSENGALISQNNRYFIFDYVHNYQSYLGKSEKYIKGTTTQGNSLLLNPKESSTTGVFGNNEKDIVNSFIKIAQPGYFNQYYVTIEAVDEDGNSSAGGNINIQNSIEKYTNLDGYKVLKVKHNRINRNDVIKVFKNYKREDSYKIIFDFKDQFPQNIGIDSIVLLPFKYNNNINKGFNKEYFDQFIYVRNLKNDPRYFSNNFNYRIESIDSQYDSQFRLTTFLNQDSSLLNDNIFSVKMYYLNSLEASSLETYLKITDYNLQSVLNYLENTDLVDKYIYLNKFIKNTDNYTSTIASSYQGVVYFFTPESFPYIAWPNQVYRSKYLNKYGARMLDFERDGVASGPEFYDYFPLAQAEINETFPSENKYKTTYRCLDSYKYDSSILSEGLDPEDVPSQGINGSASYLGVYDPGNIGDQESPQVADFKPIRNDLKYFAAKNILSVSVLSVGIQKDDAYSIIEFILDMPDAEDFIVQGISGTDSVLEKGIKEIDGINYHYFIAKFVSSCGINNDPILFGERVDTKNIVDSKKFISFVVYPTKFKVIEDPSDIPFFGNFYLLATNLTDNRFILLKQCPYTIIQNANECVDNCCVNLLESSTNRSQYKQFYIMSKYDTTAVNNFPNGKISDTNYKVLGSINWNYKAVNHRNSPYTFYYKKPTEFFNKLSLAIALYPEHNVALHKVIIYAKQINDVNNITWGSSDILETYTSNELKKTMPIIISIPDFAYSQGGEIAFQEFIKDYVRWVDDQQSFAIKIYVIDKSGDSIEQSFIFINNENI